jgi:hypothetical protein
MGKLKPSPRTNLAIVVPAMPEALETTMETPEW